MEITFLELCKLGPFIFFTVSIVSESLEKPYTFIGIRRSWIQVGNKSVYLNATKVLIPKAV